MNKLAIMCGLTASILLSLAGCQKDGLSSGASGGADGGLAQGGAGSGGAPKGGSPGAGGVFGTGGVVNTGGIVGQGGSIGTGGRTGTGGSAGTPGTGGTTSKMCGGFGGIACSAGQFCDMPAGDCGKTPDGAGTCAITESGMACPAIYAPVCGCDGKTYPSDCDRRGAGVSKSGDGECTKATTACPADLSQISAWPCTEGLTCEYGTDPRPGCRASATCTGGVWSTALAKCAQLPPVTCPATRDAAASQVCPAEGAYCTYGDLTCACTNCTNGPVTSCAGDPTWHCAAPNADAACPAGIPLLGSACATDAKTCTYACGTGSARTCKQGAWYTANGGPCPVSSRRAKKEIVYLQPSERQRLAEDLARFKLATYEYRDPALAGKRHLGFIIEDVPGSPAVDRDGNMVDLYGYASMLVAAVQAQGEEIAKLKAELARLGRQPRAK